MPSAPRPEGGVGGGGWGVGGGQYYACSHLFSKDEKIKTFSVENLDISSKLD